MNTEAGAFAEGDSGLEAAVSAIDMKDFQRVARRLERLGGSLKTPAGQVPYISVASPGSNAEIYQVTEEIAPRLQRVLLQDDFYYLIIIDGELKGVVFSEELVTVVAAVLGIDGEGAEGV